MLTIFAFVFMKKPIRYYLLLCTLFYLLGGNAFAISTNSKINIESSYWFSDPTNQIIFSQIHSIEEKGLFQAISLPKNLGYSSKTEWIKLELKNNSDEPVQAFIRWKKALTAKIQFYSYKNDSLIHQIKGHQVPSNTQTARNAIYFPIQLKPNEIREVYLRVNSPYGKELNIEIVNQDQLDSYESAKSIFIGFVIGGLFVITFYNLFIGYTIKDKLYVHYAIANISSLLGLLGTTGHLVSFFSSIPPVLSPLLISTAIGLFAITGANFIIRFLKLRQNHPISYYALIGIIVLGFLSIFSGNIIYYVFDGTYKHITMVYILSCLVCPLVCLNLYRKGVKEAKLLLIAWSGVFVGIVMKSLVMQGIIASNLFADNLMYLMFTLEAVLLSFALAARYKQMQEEKLSLERDLNQQSRDLTTYTTNHKVNYEVQKNVLEDLQKLNKSDDQELRKQLTRLMFDMNHRLSVEEKLIVKSENLSEINASFEEKLKSDFPNLSVKDLELCGYIKLQMSVKEIADLRKTSESAIKTARHRLKAKLDLSEESLDDFICGNY